MKRRDFLAISLAASAGAAALARGEAPPSDPAAKNAGVRLPALGRVKPRASKEITASPWSIGGETLDRDFAVYDDYKSFLGPLGAKAIRLQAGWAKCESTKGVYSWDWLDAIVNDAVAQGVRPWLQLSYGNTLYPGGGGTGLGGGFPTSAEALAAWDRWVAACVSRYQDRVHEWEVWNEPDLNNNGASPVSAYVDLYLRTAAIVRKIQPQGKLFALALAGKLDYAERFLSEMSERKRLDLMDAITVHTYPRNPDDTEIIDALRTMIAKVGAKIEVRQGETGAPSQFQSRFALSRIAWTENMQAKWNLRRMLAHHAKNVPANLFSLSDMHYRGENGRIDKNHKGLLETNADKSIARPKLAYSAMQTLFAIFDDSLERLDSYPFTTTAPRELAVHGYRWKNGGGQLAAVWFHDAPPDDSTETTAVDLTLSAGQFEEPVLIDMRLSTAYALPKESWKRDQRQFLLKNLPVYDSPILIAERRCVPIDTA